MIKTGLKRYDPERRGRHRSDVMIQSGSCLRVLWIKWHGFLKMVRRCGWVDESYLGHFKAWLTRWRQKGQSLGRGNGLGAVLDAALLLMMVLMPVTPISGWYGLTVLLVIKWFFFAEVQLSTKANSSLLFLILGVAIGPWFFWSEHQDILQWVRMLNWLLLAFFIGETFSVSLIRKWVFYSLWTGFFWLLVGFWQKLSGMITPAGWLEPAQLGIISVRIFSVFANPNNYALYLAVQLVFLTEILRRTENHPWLQKGCICSWFLTILALYWTYSRSGWLAGGGYLLWRLWQMPWTRWRRLGLTAIMVLPAWGTRLGSLRDGAANTLSYRLRIWQDLINILADYGWQGAGPGGFSRLYPWYQTGGSGFVQHAHQWYLQFWLEYGLISFIVLLVVVADQFSEMKNATWMKTALTGSISCFLVVGLVENWSVHLFLGGYFWMLVGLSLAMKNGGDGSNA